ncbi:class I SAM-dependent methyltransferase [Nonomuraea maheshkhaliensis]|uniref:Class I SAM-dependent methyltransferase n=1 Tax=Nonomuraea maheshkhaliensis TaxID=419590 RepID=A0ABN2FT55_9ACTN
MTAQNGKRWNHNIHYHPRVLRAIPDGAKSALDVGCGEGTLARELRRVVPHVTGVDRDPAGIARAREHAVAAADVPGAGDAKDVPDPGDAGDAGDIVYIEGDFLTHPFEPASFDVVTAVATLHHMDAATGLARMRDLLAPGGVLAVVGLARSTMPRDMPRELAAVAAGALHRVTKNHWEHPSPTVWPPPVTYPEMRALAAELLPGSAYRRHLMWRYSIVWRKPQY